MQKTFSLSGALEFSSPECSRQTRFHTPLLGRAEPPVNSPVARREQWLNDWLTEWPHLSQPETVPTRFVCCTAAACFKENGLEWHLLEPTHFTCQHTTTICSNVQYIVRGICYGIKKNCQWLSDQHVTSVYLKQKVNKMQSGTVTTPLTFIFFIFFLQIAALALNLFNCACTFTATKTESTLESGADGLVSSDLTSRALCEAKITHRNNDTGQKHHY